MARDAMLQAIRPARLEDAEALAALKLATFRETFLEGFGIPYPADDLQRFEQAYYAPNVVAAGLTDPAKATWVIEHGGELTGYAHVGPAKLPHPDLRASDGELYQIYLRRSSQGLGLGKQLLEVALAHLTKTRPGPIWLGVWSGNHKAQAIYKARGFTHVGEYCFPVGAWSDEDYIFMRPQEC
jgi:diamine N-acetyltransferase